MKQILLLLIVLVSFGSGYAQTSQLLMSENFTGYTNGNLNTTSTGQGGSYPWDNASGSSSDFVQVAKTTPLYYSGYTSGTQYVNLVPQNDYWNFSAPFFHAPDDPKKDFIAHANVTMNA